MHSAAGLDPLLPINIEKAEITRKRGSNRTAADDARLRELETIGSFWLDGNDRPTVPASAIRAVIETGARKLKQGPQVREGLVVTDTEFEYDKQKYGTTLAKLARAPSTRFLWSCSATVLCGRGPSSTCPGPVHSRSTETTSWSAQITWNGGSTSLAGGSGWVTGGPRSPVYMGGSKPPASTRGNIEERGRARETGRWLWSAARFCATIRTMTDAELKGSDLAASVDWSGFGPVCQTIYCRCDAVFRSHHKLVIVESTMRGVSQEPCPGCGSHVDAKRSSSDPESYSLRAR